MDAIAQKIQVLSKETEMLVYKRESMLNEVKQIEIRLTQLVGALDVLNTLKKELEEADEGKSAKKGRAPKQGASADDKPARKAQNNGRPDAGKDTPAERGNPGTQSDGDGGRE